MVASQDLLLCARVKPRSGVQVRPSELSCGGAPANPESGRCLMALLRAWGGEWEELFLITRHYTALHGILSVENRDFEQEETERTEGEGFSSRGPNDRLQRADKDRRRKRHIG